jgi:hypothetical protein
MTQGTHFDVAAALRRCFGLGAVSVLEKRHGSSRFSLRCGLRFIRTYLRGNADSKIEDHFDRLATKTITRQAVGRSFQACG